MSSPLEGAMKSKNWVLAFGGVVAAASVLAIWGGDMFPAEPDPKGDPESWTRDEMRRWLAARNLFPGDADTREQLLARIKANMRVPRN